MIVFPGFQESKYLSMSLNLFLQRYGTPVQTKGARQSVLLTPYGHLDYMIIFNKYGFDYPIAHQSEHER